MKLSLKRYAIEIHNQKKLFDIGFGLVATAWIFYIGFAFGDPIVGALLNGTGVAILVLLFSILSTPVNLPTWARLFGTTVVISLPSREQPDRSKKLLDIDLWFLTVDMNPSFRCFKIDEEKLVMIFLFKNEAMRFKLVHG